ncbi:MAG: hypothetical protein QOK19_2721 [Solirubrobacteraceae bacterium]|jgi:hypothetical protein|nr:hypothetical protein [Solirubrobacterales bacterium]MEA2217160.1 hypothetical protein [Solirubrobacteraceae bacterium]
MSDEPDTGVLPVPVEDGELVSAAPAGTALEPSRRGTLPVVQAAAAAAGGFVAGAAVVGLVNRRHARALAKGRGRRGLRGRRARNAGAAERLQIVGSRSLLLDVHLLGGPGAAR